VILHLVTPESLHIPADSEQQMHYSPFDEQLLSGSVTGCEMAEVVQYLHKTKLFIAKDMYIIQLVHHNDVIWLTDTKQYSHVSKSKISIYIHELYQK
jgi:hypothetical protein